VADQHLKALFHGEGKGGRPGTTPMRPLRPSHLGDAGEEPVEARGCAMWVGMPGYLQLERIAESLRR